MPTTLEVGRAGEEAALRYLQRLGFRLLHRNLRLGRLGELDLVLRQGPVLVFAEVKARIEGLTLGGFENITQAKQRKLWQLGEAYLQRHGGDHQAVRFDAVEVVFRDTALRRHEVHHLPDAFREA